MEEKGRRAGGKDDSRDSRFDIYFFFVESFEKLRDISIARRPAVDSRKIKNR